jgi:hypothetical protein
VRLQPHPLVTGGGHARTLAHKKFDNWRASVDVGATAEQPFVTSAKLDRRVLGKVASFVNPCVAPGNARSEPVAVAGRDEDVCAPVAQQDGDFDLSEVESPRPCERERVVDPAANLTLRPLQA